MSKAVSDGQTGDVRSASDVCASSGGGGVLEDRTDEGNGDQSGGNGDAKSGAAVMGVVPTIDSDDEGGGGNSSSDGDRSDGNSSGDGDRSDGEDGGKSGDLCGACVNFTTHVDHSRQCDRRAEGYQMAVLRAFDAVDADVRARVWGCARRAVKADDSLPCLLERAKRAYSKPSGRASRLAAAFDGPTLTPTEMLTLTEGAADVDTARAALAQWLRPPPHLPRFPLVAEAERPRHLEVSTTNRWMNLVRDYWTSLATALRKGVFAAATPAQRARRLLEAALVNCRTLASAHAMALVFEWLCEHALPAPAYVRTCDALAAPCRHANLCGEALIVWHAARVGSVRSMARVWRLRRDAACRLPEGLVVAVECAMTPAISVRLPCHVAFVAAPAVAGPFGHPGGDAKRQSPLGGGDAKRQSPPGGGDAVFDITCGAFGDASCWTGDLLSFTAKSCGGGGHFPVELLPLVALRDPSSDPVAWLPTRCLRVCPEVGAAIAAVADAFWPGDPAAAPEHRSPGHLEWRIWQVNRARKALGLHFAEPYEAARGDLGPALAALNTRVASVARLLGDSISSTRGRATPSVGSAAVAGESETKRSAAASSARAPREASSDAPEVERRLCDIMGGPVVQCAAALSQQARHVASLGVLARLHSHWRELCGREFAVALTTQGKWKLQAQLVKNSTAVERAFNSSTSQFDEDFEYDGDFGYDGDSLDAPAHAHHASSSSPSSMQGAPTGGAPAALEEIEARDEGGGPGAKEREAAAKEARQLRPLTRPVWDAHADALPTFPLDVFATTLAYAGYRRGPSHDALAQQLRIVPNSSDHIAPLDALDASAFAVLGKNESPTEEDERPDGPPGKALCAIM